MATSVRRPSISGGSSVSEDNIIAARNEQLSTLLAADAAAAALQDFARGQPSKRSSATSSISQESFRARGSAPSATVDAFNPSLPLARRSSTPTAPVSSVSVKAGGITEDVADDGPSAAGRVADVPKASKDESTSGDLTLQNLP